jgi:hypothetical protein
MLPSDNILKPSIFVSYAHEDEAAKSTFVKNLVDRSLAAAATLWDDRKLESGREWNKDIISHLEFSPVIFLLVSDHFIQSDFCMRTELAIARRLYEAGKAQIFVIRLTRCDGDAGGAFDGLPCWPSDGTPLKEQTSPDESLAKLRDKTKRLLVDYLKQNKGNLAILHHSFGVSAATRQTLVKRILRGAAVSSLASAAASPLVLPTVLDGIPTSLWCFGLVFGIANIADEVTSNVEKLFKKKHFPTWFECQLIPEYGVIGLLQGAIVGLIIGIVIGAFGVSVPLELAVVMVLGGLSGAFVALNDAFNSSPKLLEIFQDVGDYTLGHLSDAGLREHLDLDLLKNKQAAEKGDPRAVIAGSAVYSVADGDHSVSDNNRDNVSTDGREIEHAKPHAVGSDTPRSMDPGVNTFRRPVRVEDVPLRTVVLATPDDDREIKALLDAFESTGVSDILRLNILIDQAGLEQSEYWKKEFATVDCFIILMTPGLVSSPTHAALVGPFSETEWDIDRYVMPIRLKEFDTDLSPITQCIQALPTGGLAVADWAIPENAWLNVALNIRNQCHYDFLERLRTYTESKCFEEIEARTKDPSERRHLLYDLIDGPRHFLLALSFPYCRRAFDFHVVPFLRWNLFAVLVFAASGAPPSTWIPTPESVGPTVFTVLVLSLIFGFLAAKRHVKRIRYGQPFDDYDLLSILTNTTESFLSGNDLRWAKKQIWLSAGWVGLTTIAVGAALVALMINFPFVSPWLSAHPTLAAAACGLVVGSLAYLANCRRLPKFLIERAIPTYRSHRLRWHRGAFEVRSSRINYARKDDGVIGPLPADREELIRGYSESFRVSLLDLARAALESTLLVVAAAVIAVLLLDVGIPAPISLFAVVFMMGVGLAVLEQRLYPGRGDEPRPSYWRRLFRKSIVAALKWRLFLVAFTLAGIIVYAIGWAITWAEGVSAAFFIAIWVFAFFSRSRQLIMRSATAHRQRN